MLVSSPVEALLRELLAGSGRMDVDCRLVEGVRALLEAEWVALYQEDEGAWVCQCSTAAGPLPCEALARAPTLTSTEATRAHRVVSGRDAERASLALPLRIAADTDGLLLVGKRRDGRQHRRVALQLLTRLAPDLELALRKANELDRLRTQAFVDSLTGCYNRRGFDEHLQVELVRAKRYARPLAMMLVDLDGFKSINDELGHQSGDYVLRRFGALLTSTFRTTDIVSRYGGDEFAVIFPETTCAEAVQLAERVRFQVGRMFPDSQIPRQIAASFGVAAFPADAEGADDLVAIADRALYAAKTGGRDLVIAAAQLGEAGR